MRTTLRATALLCILAAAGDVLAQAPAAAKPAVKPAAAPAAAPVATIAAKPASNGKPIDSVYVIVNDEVITRREVDNRVAEITTRLRAQQAQNPQFQLPDADTVRRQVVEQMITERAQLQLAKDMGVRVDDATLDRAIARIAENQKLSVPDMRAQLEKEGTSFTRFREQIRNEISLQRLTEHEVDSKLQVSDAEIDTYLAAEKAAAADRVEGDLAQILIRLPEDATPEQIAARRARADEVVRQLRTGADFAKTAATYSDAPDALKGGAIGWRDLDRLPPLFSTELRKLNAGQITSILRTNVGFHILKLIDKRPLKVDQQQEPAVVQQTHTRHILIKVTPAVSADDAKKKLADIRQKVLDKKATFEDMARQNSQDGSATKGGDLGWMAPGDAMPEFENAMNALKPGEVSDVVQTPLGFHLIQVVERKSEDVSQDKHRAEARQVLTERKRQEALDDWSRQVRDKAYVEFREDK
jgi:peptidyl-prolyl cis-trans isomerase SurA